MSKTIAVMRVRDEADIIAPLIEHTLTQVDHIIVVDNGSVDGTRDILASYPVELIDDPDIAYYQSARMTHLADLAREQGADWILPVDADEIWYSPFGRIGDVLADIKPQWLVASATLYDHVSTGSDPDEPNPVKRIEWRRKEPLPLPKVACRAREDLVIQQGNHAATYEGEATIFPGLLIVRHYPYRSVAQMVQKVKNGAQAYRATDLPEDVGAHWRQYGGILDAYGEEGISGIYHQWFFSRFPELDDALIRDQAPIF